MALVNVIVNVRSTEIRKDSSQNIIGWTSYGTATILDTLGSILTGSMLEWGTVDLKAEVDLAILPSLTTSWTTAVNNWISDNSLGHTILSLVVI